MKPVCCDMRPPCCDKVGIKKGPWTPEEDIILSSYIQQHGPGKWKSVPTNTGLVRCSKSCRLRWTNYLRPGIKRGKFTPHEEVMIIHLQSSMGNKWAAIASHLPQRTDNDIKNYWNTHLKKKLKKFQSVLEPHQKASSSSFSDTHAVAAAASSVLSRFKTTTTTTPTTTTSTTTTYALSTKNISRLLESWIRNSPKNQSKLVTQEENHMNNSDILPTTSWVHDEGIDNNRVIHKVELQNCENLMSHEEFESLISFENMGCSNSPSAGEKVSSLDPDVNGGGSHQTSSTHTDTSYRQQSPFCSIEEWLLDEAPTL